ncbi:MAG: type VII secretion protein EccB [Micromonosporaceae bacterium]
MATRRDQLHSYQFMIQRVVAALVMRETDPAQSPFRRAAGAIFAGVMVATILVAGFAVYGLMFPGGNMRWKTASDQDGGRPVVIVEEETGATYVYMNGTLHPMENYTSAILLGKVGASGGQTSASRQNAGGPFYVSRDSLAGVQIPIGVRMGIPGAPDSLPSQKNLISGDWTLCSQPKRTVSGGEELETVMVVGARPSPYQNVAGEGVILVEEAETTKKYLIYQSHRFEILEQDDMFSAFGLDSHTPLKVSTAWLSALPVGQEIKALDLPDAGEPSDAKPDTTVGDIFRVQTNEQYFVALKDELAVITEFQARLLQASTGSEFGELIPADPATKSPSRELLPEVSEPDVKAPPESATMNMEEPDSARATCAIFGNRGNPPVMVHSGSLSAFKGAGVVTELRGDEGTQLASRVVVPTGRGALVWTSQSPDDRTAATLGLVTDTGKFYPLSSQEVVSMLGYDLKTVKPGWMPSSLVGRLQAGPTLDRAAASDPVLPPPS